MGLVGELWSGCNVCLRASVWTKQAQRHVEVGIVPLQHRAAVYWRLGQLSYELMCICCCSCKIHLSFPKNSMLLVWKQLPRKKHHFYFVSLFRKKTNKKHFEVAKGQQHFPQAGCRYDHLSPTKHRFLAIRQNQVANRWVN